MAPAASLTLAVLALTVLAVHGSVYVHNMCPYSSDGHSLSHHQCRDDNCPYGQECCGTSSGGSVCRYTGCDVYHKDYRCPEGHTCRAYTPHYCPYGPTSHHCRTAVCERQPRECPPLKHMPLVHSIACNQSLSHMQCPYGQYCCATYSGGAMCTPKDPCYNKLCSPGKMCQQQGPAGSAIAQCVDDPCSAHGTCPPGYYCETSLTYSCINPPCPPATHRCVPPTRCDKHCGSGYECRLKMVFCVTAPCLPVPECVPITTDPCRHHTCPHDHVCRVKPNPCLSCPPEAECVPRQPNPCQNYPCPQGQHCIVTPINCLVPPCPPGTPTCVPDLGCAATTCPTGTPCNPQTGRCEQGCQNHQCPPGHHCAMTLGGCFIGPCPGTPVCLRDLGCAATTCPTGTPCNPQTGRCEPNIANSTQSACAPINLAPPHHVSECNVRNPATCPDNKMCCLNSAAGTRCVDRAPSDCPPPHLLPNIVTLSCLESDKGYENNHGGQICCQTRLGGSVWTNPVSHHCNDHQRCPSPHQYCRNGQCWPNNCANYPCPTGHTCDHQTGECVYYDVNRCPAPTIGVCVIACTRNSCGHGTICCPTGCGGMTCVPPAPQHPCSLVLCAQGFRCNNRTGQCEPISNMCGGRHCPPGTECDWARWMCVTTVSGQCPTYVGDLGTCAVTCRLDQHVNNGPPSCTNGRICCGTECGGTTCVHPVNTNICAGVRCEHGHHCHPALGTCVPNDDDPCARVRCRSGTYCHYGQCLPVCGKDAWGQIIQPDGPCGTAHYSNSHCRKGWMCVSNHYMGGRYCCPAAKPHKTTSIAVNNRPSSLLGIPLTVLMGLLLKALSHY